MKIRQKLLLGFLSNSILLGFIGAVAILTNIHNEYHIIQLSESSIKELEAATQMTHALEATQIGAHKLLLKRYTVAKLNNIEKTQEAQIQIRANLNEFIKYLTQTKKATNFTISLAQTRFFLTKVEQEQNELEMLNDIEIQFYIYHNLVKQYLFIIDIEKAGQFLEETLEPHFQERILPLIQEYESDARAELNSQSTKTLGDIDGAKKIISAATLVAIATAVFSGLFISYSIVKPIHKLERAAIRIGKGNLNTKVNIKSKDEIGVLADAFNQMSDRLDKTTVSKSYIDNIIKSMLDILIVTDSDTIITRVNQATFNILGYEESELLGKSIEIIFGEKNFFDVLNINKLKQEGFVENIETTYLTKSSSKITVSFSASVIRDDHRQIQGIVYVAQDISERKRAEEANARLATAVEYAADAIEITDTEARFEYVNPAFEKVTGYTRAEVLGKTSASLLRSDKHDAAFYQRMSDTIASGQVWSGSYIGKREDGALYYQEATISPVRNSAGEIINHVAVKRDITERKRLEERLAKINECFLSFVPDPTENINRLTAVCGELLEATSTIYSRIEKGVLCLVGRWHIPEGFSTGDHPDSHICYQVIQQGSKKPLIIVDLSTTTYAQTNSNIMSYGWKTYIGQAVKCKDISVGSLCAVYEQNFIHSDADKTVIGIIAAAIGVEEERRWTQEALRESKERYRAVVEQASEGILIIDADSKLLLETNPAFQNLLGYTCEEMLGLTLHDVTSREDESINCNIQHILTEKSHCICERQYRRKDNSLVDVETNINLISYEGREVLCIILRDITERKAAEKQLLYNAFHDTLTGLANRALFMERLGHAIALAKRREDYLFAVLFLDLDRFKVVNDSLGHMVGDQLLIAITRRLEVCLRPGDTFARLGGDEFTILLENIKDVADATCVADRIQAEFTLPFNLNGHEVFSSTSIGIALSTTGYKQPEDLLRDADITMYRAKAGGKARTEVFNLTMHTQAMALLQLETDLTRSLLRQEFQLSYQPIVSLNSGTIKGFEALVRWHHPDQGIISPTEFIPLAEETGLIVPLGYWVLREACRQMKTWQMQFLEKVSLTISVNISGKQFLQSDLVAQISQILAETGLAPRSLGLEITETAIMENPEAAANMLLQLRDIGVRLYMDDFGTGYSSLSYLHRFPIDTLKIDRSFINDVDVDAEKIEIIRTVVALAWNLGMDVVAEGVETNKQMHQLKALRCEFGQGYFFSRPLDSKMAEALIAAELQ